MGRYGVRLSAQGLLPLRVAREHARVEHLLPADEVVNYPPTVLVQPWRWLGVGRKDLPKARVTLGFRRLDRRVAKLDVVRCQPALNQSCAPPSGSDFRLPGHTVERGRRKRRAFRL